MSYANDLHEALLAKNGPSFWKCWRSKFDTRSNCTQVDGYIEPLDIANKFANYFSEIYAPQRASSLHNEYIPILLRENYFGFPMSAGNTFDMELVSKVMFELKLGKAPQMLMDLLLNT